MALAQHSRHCLYITVTSAEALNFDKLTGKSPDDVLSLLEGVRLVWARPVGLLIVVKVNIDNKGAHVQEAIRDHYLKRLMSLLKAFVTSLAGLTDRFC